MKSGVWSSGIRILCSGRRDWDSGSRVLLGCRVSYERSQGYLGSTKGFYGFALHGLFSETSNAITFSRVWV